MKVKTGFGYFVEKTTGRILHKYDLPKGIHPLSSKFNYHEVANRQKLDEVEVYIEPSMLIPTDKAKLLELLNDIDVQLKIKGL